MNDVTVLVCDDNQDILSSLEIYLTGEGFRVFTAKDGLEAISQLHAEPHISIIIMDIMMPNMDGIHATLKIRKEKNIPIIILSAKSEDHDKILGLNVGADDYVTKPFNPLELIARVKSQLRRYTQLSGPPPKDDVLQSGELIMDDQKKTVQVDGELKSLTPVEYKLLRFLLENKGRVFTSEQLYDQVWGEESLGADNTIAVHIRHIREKIEINPKEPRYLKVVWGHGYKVEDIKS
ncbi:MAG: response regulator transcription factor [Clostridiaceae bacterium]|nr:response regulator transcription factor [Clostridiaceae bacterium]